MRVPLREALALLLLTGLAGTSLAQPVSSDQKRYYEAVSPNGDPLPKPDPWCEIAAFGSRSLWACPVLSREEGYIASDHGDASAPQSGGGSASGGGSSGGGDAMGGGSPGGGMGGG